MKNQEKTFNNLVWYIKDSSNYLDKLSFENDIELIKNVVKDLKEYIKELESII